jgi:ATP-dependent Clp protease adaptor protein ClpS
MGLTELKESTFLSDKKSDLKDIFIVNDEYNTFEWVIKCLIKICGHTPLQAEQCALITHHKGECHVKKTTPELSIVISEKLKNCGLSCYIK